jgi:hypothetical protein
VPITDLLPTVSFSPPARPVREVRAGRAAPDTGRNEEAPRARPARPARPLPSYAVATIGGLALACLALTVALAATVSARPAAEGPVARAPSDTAAARPAPAAASADPRPIPVDLLARLEAAGDEPVATELGALLGAVQHGFGTESAHLEPTLGSYAARTAARIDRSSTDTFYVAVTAPSPALAEARAALVSRLFSGAVGDDRLRVSAGTGPHALTLVSD